MKALQPGTTLQNGKYTIIQILGQGSFGITYLATTKIAMQGGIGRMDMEVRVAIKEFFMSDLNSRSSDGNTLEKTDSSLVKKYARKFHSEAENLAKLHHPNIVKVLEVFDENNTSYYVMEYIEGETLDDYIKRNGKIGEEEARLITLDICGALRHMHDHHMLHLDLKPKNVMRDHKGKISLIDFGLAKQYNENGEPESSTTLGLGTRGYAPVEQMKYKSDGTMPATLDIYALGATLFKMLTGQVPPESSDVLNEGLPVNLLQDSGISQNMIAIVEKAMAPLKKNRYQQVGELVDALSLNIPHVEETVVGQPEEETVVQNSETVNEPPAYYENEGTVNVTPAYDDEEPSFLQKYWKYGLLALIPLLILGGVLLFSGGSKNKDGNDTRKHDVIAANNDYDGDDVNAEEAAEDAYSMEEEDNMEETQQFTVPEIKEDVDESKQLKSQEDLDKDIAVGSIDQEGTKEITMEVIREEPKPEPQKPVENTNVYTLAELDIQPSFPGGTSAMYQWLSMNLEYPPVAQENGIQGTVIVGFVVEKNGSITDIKVMRGKDPSLDKEALRVVSKMPKWRPGMQNGQAVRVSYTLPVKFALQ